MVGLCSLQQRLGDGLTIQARIRIVSTTTGTIKEATEIPLAASVSATLPHHILQFDVRRVVICSVTAL